MDKIFLSKRFYEVFDAYMAFLVSVLLNVLLMC